MFTIKRHIKYDKEALRSPNLCGRFLAEDLAAIGREVCEGYKRDKRSRYKWERRNQAAMDLALQVQKAKTFPWPDCSNIAFPLVTIAALQFHSRAYPAIVSGTEVVKCRVIGEDNDGKKTARAERISTHMSWQVLEEDQSWEEQQDRLLINLPIVGSAFKKSLRCSDKAINKSELVLAADLVLDYYAKSVEECGRKTHLIPLSRNDIYTRVKRGVFRDVLEDSWYTDRSIPDQTPGEIRTDNRRGIEQPAEPDSITPFMALEQHTHLDLDGDGYAEPYIITIEEKSEAVLRIVTACDREEDIEYNDRKQIVSVKRTEYFTKYGFIPSPDGGIYDLGFGVLLGPLNESANSLINQLVDAGTMSVTAGGFLGKGSKIRGGVYQFAPLEWKRVDSTGDDLRKNIYPLPVREPNAVLFQLLSLLINYVQRISGTTDPMVGEPTGQNTPAETTRAMIQEGMRIYSAVFKRIWRSMKQEFGKLYVLNGLYMPMRKNFGSGQFALREDYLGNPDEVAPAADPNVASEQMQLAQAQMLKQAAMATPGYDPDAVERRYLKALKIPDIDEIFPGVQKTGAPKDTKVRIQELRNQLGMAELQMKNTQFMLTLSETIRKNDAEIAKLVAEIEDMRATQAGDEQDRRISLLNNILGTLKTHNETIKKQLEVMRERLKVENEASADGRTVPGLAGPPSNAGAAAGAVGQAAAA